MDSNHAHMVDSNNQDFISEIIDNQKPNHGK